MALTVAAAFAAPRVCRLGSPGSEARELLTLTSSLAAEWLESLEDRRVLPDVDAEALRRTLEGSLPDGGTASNTVDAELARAAGHLRLQLVDDGRRRRPDARRVR